MSWWTFGERGIYYTAFPKPGNDSSVYIEHHWALGLYEGIGKCWAKQDFSHRHAQSTRPCLALRESRTKQPAL